MVRSMLMVHLIKRVRLWKVALMLMVQVMLKEHLTDPSMAELNLMAERIMMVGLK